MRLPAIVLLGIGILGSVAVLVATRWGIGVEYDSVFYLSAAENLLHGLGLSRLGGGGEIIPLTHYPPLYPLLLSIISWVSGATVSSAARAVSAIFFGALAFVGGLVVARSTRSWAAGAAGAILLAASPVLLSVEIWAMSEVVYLVLLVAALGLLAAYAQKPTRSYLLASAAVTAAAYAARYVGIALVGTGVLVVLVSGSWTWRRRLLRAAAFGSLGVLPVIIWMGRNLILTGSTTNRVLLYHPLGRDKVSEAAHTVAGWILPASLPFRLSLVVTLLILAVLALYVGRSWWNAGLRGGPAWEPRHRLLGVLALHGMIYGALLVVSLTFLDASTRLDDRILSPIYLVLLMAFVLAGELWLAELKGRAWTRIVLVVILAGVLAVSVPSSLAVVRASADHGLGFNSRGWVAPPTVAWLESQQPGGAVYSNEAFPLYYLTGRPIYWAPEAVDPVKGEPRPQLEADLALMRERLREPGSYLIIFHPGHLRAEMPPLVDLTEGLTLLEKTSDAEIYVAP